MAPLVPMEDDRELRESLTRRMCCIGTCELFVPLHDVRRRGARSRGAETTLNRRSTISRLKIVPLECDFYFLSGDFHRNRSGDLVTCGHHQTSRPRAILGGFRASVTVKVLCGCTPSPH